MCSSFEELDIGDLQLEAVVCSVVMFFKYRQFTYLSKRKSKEEVLIELWVVKAKVGPILHGSHRG
jgi:hypothetical protein